eukprot:TRINITY_DN15177_c0_g1_i1.p1 TRINITY_DN15177_c0_g1~~TRINITY_DN15177_c0_g1_i1.p1  ORF type:complete len:389 (+),score=106.73 TRINITY_DN15177_c0_g1_i1:90-1256(+)
MQSVLLASAVAAIGHAAPPAWVPQEVREWAREQNKHYATEAAWRRAATNYLASSQMIQKMNEDESDSAEYAHNAFSDLSPAEFAERLFPAPMDIAKGREGASVPDDVVVSDMPASADWRQQNAVTPVRDQASCGSCWAHSAVGNMESLWFLANKASMSQPVPLSVEQVVECDEHDYSCYGGYMKGAYEYTIEHGGLASEADYATPKTAHTICLPNQTFNETCGDGMCDDPPLTSYCDLTCSDKKHKSVAKIASWVALPTDEDKMAAYLAQHGPVSVGINAQGGFLGVLFPWLQFYKKGIANPKGCKKDTVTSIDHGVLLVGYGEENGQKYWIVKNSWGGKWGEDGYFRLVRGQGSCAINLMATSAVINKAALLPNAAADVATSSSFVV